MGVFKESYQFFSTREQNRTASRLLTQGVRRVVIMHHQNLYGIGMGFLCGFSQDLIRMCRANAELASM